MPVLCCVLQLDTHKQYIYCARFVLPSVVLPGVVLPRFVLPRFVLSRFVLPGVVLHITHLYIILARNIITSRIKSARKFFCQ